MSVWADLVGSYKVAIDENLSAWLCGTWTVVERAPSDEVLAAWSACRDEVARVRPVDASNWVLERFGVEIDETPCAVVIDGDDWVGLFEPWSFHGSDHPVIERLAQVGASVTTLYWNQAIGRCELTRRVGDASGAMDFSVEDGSNDWGEVDLGTVPAIFRDEASDAAGVSAVWAVGLAMVETWTGAALPMTRHATAEPLITFSPDDVAAAKPAAALDASDEITDQTLLDALRLLAPEHQRQVGADVAEVILRARALADLPGVAEGIAELRHGTVQPGPGPAGLQQSMADVWAQTDAIINRRDFATTIEYQRNQAMLFLGDLRNASAFDADSYFGREGYESAWTVHATYAIPDQWPALRAATLARTARMTL